MEIVSIRVHDIALQDNKGSNPLQDMVHDLSDDLLKRIHKHKSYAYHKHKPVLITAHI